MKPTNYSISNNEQFKECIQLPLQMMFSNASKSFKYNTSKAAESELITST